MVRESVIEKWIENIEDFIIWGLPPNYYENPDNLNDSLDDAIDDFCRVNRYSERTYEDLLNTIDVRDIFFKTLSKEGYTLPCDAESMTKPEQEDS